MNYTQILNDPTIVQMYEDVNNQIHFVIDHGLLHVKHVVANIKHICRALQLSKNTQRLACIAGALHDVGRLYSKENHAEESAIFAKTYLQNKLTQEECETVCYAIAHHEREKFDYTTTNDVAWVLLLADKMDNKRSRYIRALMKPKYKEAASYSIKNITLVPQNTHIVVQMDLYHEKIMQDEKTYVLFEFISKILQHFGYTSSLKFVMAKQQTKQTQPKA